jgi:hypothetical protein
MVERHEVAWCTLCGARFTAAEIDGHSACPKCGTKGVPCDPNKDMAVVVNWHELRILGIWAENWAQHCERASPGDPGNATVTTVHAITRRLQRQHPDETPLTLSGEIMQIKDHGIGIEGYNIAKNSIIPVNGPGAVLQKSKLSTENP